MGPNSGGRERPPTEKGDKVSFRVSDVFLPEVEDLRTSWADHAEVEGTVVDFSDSGSAPRVFAVVEVIQRHTVIVPVVKLKLGRNPS
jgi:hypothetical protein